MWGDSFHIARSMVTRYKVRRTLGKKRKYLGEWSPRAPASTQPLISHETQKSHFAFPNVKWTGLVVQSLWSCPSIKIPYELKWKLVILKNYKYHSHLCYSLTFVSIPTILSSYSIFPMLSQFIWYWSNIEDSFWFHIWGRIQVFPAEKYSSIKQQNQGCQKNALVTQFFFFFQYTVSQTRGLCT